MSMARSMMKEKELSLEMWGEAINTSVYTLNISPTNSLQGTIPYEKLTGRKPYEGFWLNCPREGHRKKLKKFDDRSKPMGLIAYEKGSKASKCYDPLTMKVHISMDISLKTKASGIGRPMLMMKVNLIFPLSLTGGS